MMLKSTTPISIINTHVRDKGGHSGHRKSLLYTFLYRENNNIYNNKKR